MCSNLEMWISFLSTSGGSSSRNMGLWSVPAIVLDLSIFQNRQVRVDGEDGVASDGPDEDKGGPTRRAPSAYALTSPLPERAQGGREVQLRRA